MSKLDVVVRDGNWNDWFCSLKIELLFDLKTVTWRLLKNIFVDQAGFSLLAGIGG